MPFTMTHLAIAYELCEKLSIGPDDLPQYFLGNVAPDAVHYRSNYDSDMKKASHLCVGDERWGMSTKNAEWADNALLFLKAHDDAFALGYVIHILSDIYNNIAVWTPFRTKYAEELKKGYGNFYHLECGKIDLQLVQTYAHKDEIWRNLESAKGTGLGDFIFAEEIERQRENILCRQYADAEPEDTSKNRIVTYESTMAFIKNAAEFAQKSINGT